MPRHCIDTLRGIMKCRANSTTTAIIAVRQVKPFEVSRERAMYREEDSTTTAIIAVRQVKPFEVGRERSMLREDPAYTEVSSNQRKWCPLNFLVYSLTYVEKK
ncbi:hypothetical protein AVEN_213218-1 [Araneus ventricosus]|uniref:Uncharacterized protein n=1 Tax=Araneus ventricosus TaxID=182803 RepID=A0A4Y2SZ47_ARAVE|nr:hypothetical protein AVEN_213218-1 [Araneus ventricosus]